MASGDLLVAQESFIYLKKSKKSYTHDDPYPGLDFSAIYRTRKLSQLALFMDLVILRTLFTVSVISKPPDGFWAL